MNQVLRVFNPLRDSSFGVALDPGKNSKAVFNGPLYGIIMTQRMKLRDRAEINLPSSQELGTSALVPRSAWYSPDFLLSSSDKLGKVISIKTLSILFRRLL